MAEQKKFTRKNTAAMFFVRSRNSYNILRNNVF